VHLFSHQVPPRLARSGGPVQMHVSQGLPYPLFTSTPHDLAVTSAILRVHRDEGLDILHAHYALPHAVSAFLARSAAQADRERPAPRMVTTLHGTDITLVGNDASYSEIVAFSIEQSDHVTAVSQSLRDSTYAELGVTRDIEVIPNFLDCAVHCRQELPDLRKRLTDGDPAAKILVHVSNFRPVKRIDYVMAIFDRVRRQLPARLLLVGDGPDLPLALRTARELGISDLIHAVGAQEEVQPLLSVSDVFLLPSKEESFGLAALEAMACGVPVVGARVGGVPEVIEHGVTGFLHPLEDLQSMAESAIRLLSDAALHRRAAQAGRRTAHERYCDSKIVPIYEAYYREILERS
jgi:N-acetyl-alpha-D-glucosaminyl L-malate synthase BshA